MMTATTIRTTAPTPTTHNLMNQVRFLLAPRPPSLQNVLQLFVCIYICLRNLAQLSLFYVKYPIMSNYMLP
jgi:hypothetical protein